MEPIKGAKTNKIIRKPAGHHKRYASGFDYQKDGTYFAQVNESLVDAASKELEELGAEIDTVSFRGITFKTDKSGFYKINYMTRLLSRTLAPLASFSLSDTDELYKKAKTIKWELLFAKKSTFAVQANVTGDTINHSHFASLRLKDAIADYFRDRTGRRPDVNTKNPDLLINLHVHDKQAVISLDTSKGPLHKRGYREASVPAPIQETVAAAIIRLSGWDGSIPLYDPLCGSGTLLSEALMAYCSIPAGIFRESFGFEHLPDFDSDLWNRVKQEADAGIREMPPGLIAGSDLSPAAVDAARTNLMGIHSGGNVTIKTCDFKDIPELKDCVIVTNPPYGIRLGKDTDLEQFHKTFGDFLKQKCTGSTVYIYFGDPRYIRFMGLKSSWKKPLRTGGLDGMIVKYTLY